MKGNKPKLIFSERTADELLEAVNTIKSLRQKNSDLHRDVDRYRRALNKIVCLNIPMPDEVFKIANGVLEEWIVKQTIRPKRATSR